MSPVVPETVKLLVSTAMPPSKLTSVLVVAPRPVTVARVSASDVRPVVEETVIVEPEVLIVVPPDPLTSRSPAKSLTLVTISVSSRLTTGRWPPATLMPVPPETE